MGAADDRRLRRVVTALRASGFEPVLIGAAAMVPYGYMRATDDIDVMVWDRRAYRAAVYAAVNAGVVDVRIAEDDDDPVVALARIGARSRRPVDVVMPRGAWHKDAVVRAQSNGPRVTHAGVTLAAVTLPDLIVMKLESGSIPGRNDAHQLLALADDREAVEVAVTELLPAAPREARRSWNLLKSTPL